jgi:hypothetical protein
MGVQRHAAGRGSQPPEERRGIYFVRCAFSGRTKLGAGHGIEQGSVFSPRAQRLLAQRLANAPDRPCRCGI